MALSMDEQRALAEIERRLAADDPGLATCLTAFRRPGPATVLRSPRARIVGSLFTVLLVAMVSLMVYAMIPFRTHGARTPVTSSTGTQGHVAITGRRNMSARRRAPRPRRPRRMSAAASATSPPSSQALGGRRPAADAAGTQAADQAVAGTPTVRP